MIIVRRVAALLTLALSFETTLLGSAVTCAMRGGDDAATAGLDMTGMEMAGMDMSGMDMTSEQSQSRDNTPASDEESCPFPWSPPGSCHDMEACVPMAIAPPAVALTVAAPISAVVPLLLPGLRSLGHTPDPPPPRA